MDYGTEIREIQLVILGIFKEIIRICDENDISYFIIGGTALGAVRHSGFIPWDDDLDIGMTRNNYDKFLEIARDNLPEDLFLQTVVTDPESPFYFSKVRKNGTRFVTKYCREINMHHGIYVDIFPYDNIPDDPRLQKKHYNKVKFWSGLFIAKSLTESSTPQKGLSGRIKLLARKIVHIALTPIPKRVLYKKLDLACREYNNTPTEIMSYVKYPYLRIPSADLSDLERITFEGMKVSCPKNIGAYLTHNYGDYMKLPPIDKRMGHRPHILEL